MTEDCPRLEGRCNFRTRHHQTRVSVFNDEGTYSCFTSGSVWDFFSYYRPYFSQERRFLLLPLEKPCGKRSWIYQKMQYQRMGRLTLIPNRKGRSPFLNHTQHISPNSISLRVHRSLITSFCPALSQCL